MNFSVVRAENVPVYEKGWGYERWIHNDEDYCGKELVLLRGKRCSIHYHMIKKETFYMVEGTMLVETYNRPFETPAGVLLETTLERIRTEDSDFRVYKHIMEAGDSLLIEPKTPHRFIGIEEVSKFMEFSTQHFEDDSYRIYPGDSQNV